MNASLTLILELLGAESNYARCETWFQKTPTEEVLRAIATFRKQIHVDGAVLPLTHWLFVSRFELWLRTHCIEHDDCFEYPNTIGKRCATRRRHGIHTLRRALVRVGAHGR